MTRRFTSLCGYKQSTGFHPIGWNLFFASYGCCSWRVRQRWLVTEDQSAFCSVFTCGNTRLLPRGSGHCCIERSGELVDLTSTGGKVASRTCGSARQLKQCTRCTSGYRDGLPRSFYRAGYNHPGAYTRLAALLYHKIWQSTAELAGRAGEPRNDTKVFYPRHEQAPWSTSPRLPCLVSKSHPPSILAHATVKHHAIALKL